jgi:hypothetical protein
MIRTLLLAAIVVCFGGCSASLAPRTHLDPVTAATITVQAEPIVLAFDDQLRASNARDYLQLAAIEINRMGSRELYLGVLHWSTIDRTSAEHDAAARELRHARLLADDRPIELSTNLQERPAGLGVRPYPLPIPGAREFYFPIQKEQLRAIALSRSLTLTPLAPAAGHTSPIYRDWQDGRAGLLRFLESVR